MQAATYPTGLDTLVRQSGDAANLLRLLANEQRLLVLCNLAAAGELSVSQLGQRLDLSQSALSQHLARLRADRIVGSRREGQSIIYHIADEKARRVLALLHELFCPELEGNSR